MKHNTLMDGGDEQFMLDITQARDTLSTAIDTGLDIEIPAWLLPVLYTDGTEREQRALGNAQATLDLIRSEAARNHVGTLTRTVIEPVVPNKPLNEVRYIPVEQAVVGYLRDGDTSLPITNHRCLVCKHLVDLCKPDEFMLMRANGDSENGYEAMHTVCA